MSKENWESFYQAFKKGDWDDADTAIRRISALSKEKNPNVLIQMAEVSLNAGDPAKAVSCYHQAAELYREQGSPDKALALYKIILGISPDDSEAVAHSRKIMMEIETAAIPAAASEAGISELFSGMEDLVVPISGRKLEGVPELFVGMSPREYEYCLAEFEEKSFSPGETIIEEGGPGESMYIIKNGKARVTANILGKEVRLAILDEGDVFGEVAFLTGRPRTASVIAETYLEAYEISRQSLEKIISGNPEVLARIEYFYEKRIKETIKKVKPEPS